MGTTTQYRVIDAGSCEPLTEWTDSLSQVHVWLDECSMDDSEPECRVVEREVLLPNAAGVRWIESVYREAGLTQQPGGVVVSIQDGRYHVADDHHGEYYDCELEAIAGVKSWLCR
jgi:hypothetical protein